VPPTLVAEQEDGGLRFDIRLQGERQTVFFAV
jgi:protocatechuate 3,4-dioxygenase beta subunit